MARLEFIGFRASREEREALENLARAQKQNLSQVMRTAIMRAAAELEVVGGYSPTYSPGDHQAAEVQGER